MSKELRSVFCSASTSLGRFVANGRWCYCFWRIRRGTANRTAARAAARRSATKCAIWRRNCAADRPSIRSPRISSEPSVRSLRPSFFAQLPSRVAYRFLALRHVRLWLLVFPQKLVLAPKENLAVDRRVNQFVCFPGKIDKTDWQMQVLEKKIEENQQAGAFRSAGHDTKVPKWNRDAFTDKVNRTTPIPSVTELVSVTELGKRVAYF